LWGIFLHLQYNHLELNYIHQQDLRPTLSNLLCRPIADVITVNFAATARHFPPAKTRVIGNPIYIRKSSEGQGKDNFQLTETKPLLVVTGGGSGAKQLNDLMLESEERLGAVFNIFLVSGRGKTRSDMSDHGSIPDDSGNYRAGRSNTSKAYLQVIEFTPNLFSYLARADLVVTRGGLATLTELAHLAKPVIIIPLPHSHQEDNAKYFAAQGAAEYFPLQSYAVGKKEADEFVEFVFRLWGDKGKVEELKKNIKKLYRPDAVEKWKEMILMSETSNKTHH